jgi:hypothetical protein
VGEGLRQIVVKESGGNPKLLEDYVKMAQRMASVTEEKASKD